jgi:hypothetical protein
MVKYQFTTSLTILLLGFICGVCMSVLFIGCGGCNRSPVKTTTTKALKQQEMQVDSTCKKAKLGLDSVKTILQHKIVATKSNLSLAKTSVTKRKQVIQKLIEPKGFSATELRKKISPVIPDSTLTNCDSLTKEISFFIQESEIKDSLYEKQIGTLDNLVLTQDAIIKNDSVAYHNLQRLFHQAIVHGEVLEKDNRQLEQKMKRQKVKSKIVSLGLMLISGFATNYFIRR